ncbi:MAG TPA: hypothetical protein PLQ97_00390 [Myxococcota bacterium]|nr:hypothetical protein [Myxococcota bacterium]HQK49632.1 hypothetical protein [Myxococcota bacterium]
MEGTEMRLPRGQLPVPSLHRLGWPDRLSAAPEVLPGRVVLLFLWDFAQVESLRVLPYLRAWHGRHASNGLSVLGVLLPRLGFGRDPFWTRRILDQMGLPFPVAVDRDLDLWEALGTPPIPSAYLVDRTGFLADCLVERGPWPPFEQSIQALLREGHGPLVFPPVIEPLRPEDQTGFVPQVITPPVPFGYLQGRLGNPEGFSPDQVVQYPAGEPEHRGSAWMEGAFRNLPDAQEHAEGESALVRIDYEARVVWLVASPARAGRVGRVQVRQDGVALARELRGDDLPTSGEEAILEVPLPGVFQIVRNPAVGPHRLVLRSLTPGLRFHRLEFTEHP